MRGTAVGFLGAMMAGGLLIGAGLWTVLIMRRPISPGQELEAIAA